MKTDNVIEVKSKAFAIRIVRLYQWMCENKHENVLSKQVLRSGTSIGANVKEGLRAQSSADFIAKLSISLKEAEETEYWLELLHEGGYINDDAFNSMYQDNKELIKILISIINTTKSNNNKA